MNILCLCHNCHRFYTENPVEFNTFCFKHLGAAHMEILREKKNMIFKTTKAIRADIAKHYREQVKLLEAGGHELVSYQ